MNNGIFEIFDRIYIINMAKHVERWSNVIEECRKIGIVDFIRKEGVVINNGHTKEDREKGCKTSHIEILEEAKKLNLHNVLIMEDDCVFENCALETLEKSKSLVKEANWDIFYLGGNPANHNNRKVNDNLIQVEYWFATHCYAVNKQCYDKIIAYKDLPLPYDVALIPLQIDGKCFCTNPRIAYQREGESEILKANVNYDIVLRDKK
jgi:GR25 family glycosyltransferase involved in LPS biosynthesis